MLFRSGLTGFFLSIAALHLLLLPLMLGVADPPSEPRNEEDASAVPAMTPGSIGILGSAIFWLIVMGDGILNGTAIAGAAHMLPIVEGYGISVETGALLLSVSGASSIIGSLLAGYACDHIGSARTLALAASGFALAWALIAVSAWLPALMISAFLIGLCGAAVFPPLSALAVQIFGMEALPRVLGLLGVMTLPFTFLMSPAAGWLHDLLGGYEPAFAMLIGACLLAAMLFFGMSFHFNRKARTVAEPSSAPLSPARPI